jgi:uncharacterized protein YbjT (DUF2867 family)
VSDALANAHAAVNAISLYTERDTQTFHAVHMECAERVAAEAHRIGIEQLVHVSGIGADPASGSPYVRSRGQGELAVRAAYPGAVLVRPAVMFGPDDTFLTVILKLLQTLPAYPMFGSGTTRLQPAHVEDVGEAIARVLQRTEQDPTTLECGGPPSLLLQRASQEHSRRSWPQAHPASGPVCRLVCNGSRNRDLAEPTHHAKSGRAYAD